METIDGDDCETGLVVKKKGNQKSTTGIGASLTPVYRGKEDRCRCQPHPGLRGKDDRCRCQPHPGLQG